MSALNQACTENHTDGEHRITGTDKLQHNPCASVCFLINTCAFKMT
jgi:hypothetical protein